MSTHRWIPRPALVLGWLGVLPFAKASLLSVFASGRLAELASQALVLYGAIILSFMGGVQWGLAMPAGDQDRGALLRRLGLSTLPALGGFAVALLLSPRAAMVGLAGLFLALLAYDVTTVRAGLAPAWYEALRMQLTGAVVVCLLLAASLGRT